MADVQTHTTTWKAQQSGCVNGMVVWIHVTVATAGMPRQVFFLRFSVCIM
jgi:uncharacterized membrane-anchored protein